jgi:hypothetical protein
MNNSLLTFRNAVVAQLLASLLCAQLHATSFVGVYRAGVLYLGGDTLAGSVNPATGVDNSTNHFHRCKMLLGGRFLLAEGGVWSLSTKDKLHGVRDYELDKSVEPILKKNGTPEFTFKAVNAVAIKFLLSIPQLLKEIGVRHITGDIVVKFSLLWFDRGSLVSHEGKYRLWEANGQIRHEAFDLHELVVPDGDYYGFGYEDALKPPPTARAMAIPEAFIRKTLAKQTTITPNDVGPPYSLIEFSTIGHQWTDDAGFCKGR